MDDDESQIIRHCKKMKIILPCLLVIWNWMFLLLLEEYNQKVSSEKRPFQFDQQQILTFLWNLICKYLRSSVSEKSSKKFRLARYVTICLTFPQCALSNVSSNGWHRQMHSRIGCICVTFLLHYWFSQGNININPSFTNIIIFNMLIHHNQVGNVPWKSFSTTSALSPEMRPLSRVSL